LWFKTFCLLGRDCMAEDISNTSTPYLPGFLRSLGAFEEIYWLYTQSGPRGFAYAAEMEGSTTVEAWRKAIDKVQQSQPFFSVCIEPNPDGSLIFVVRKELQFPMRNTSMYGRISPKLRYFEATAFGVSVQGIFSMGLPPVVARIRKFSLTRTIFRPAPFASFKPGAHLLPPAAAERL
jgi:hypothetical protein